MFIAHWVDNAFAGAALEGGDKGAFINVFNRYQTGHYFRTGPCPYEGQGEEADPLNAFEMTVLAEFFPRTAPIAAEPPPSYPPGRQCNAKGLTKLGAYLVRRLIDEHMLIEVDHLGEWARKRVLEIAAKPRLPAGLGPHQHRRHLDAGGARSSSTGSAASPRRPRPQAPQLAAKFAALRGYQGRRRAGIPLGTDTGGFSSLPEPREDAADQPAALPVPLLRRQGQLRPPDHRRAQLRPQHRRGRALRAVRRPDRRHAALRRRRARRPLAVPLRRGLPADVAARVLRG